MAPSVSAASDDFEFCNESSRPGLSPRPDGFRILVRDSPVAAPEGTYSSLLNEAVRQVGHILAGDFARRGFDPELAPLYAQALVGMVATTATWWLDERAPSKEVVAAHLVNLGWNGLAPAGPFPALPALPDWQAAALHWRAHLFGQPPLVEQLLDFVAGKR